MSRNFDDVTNNQLESTVILIFSDIEVTVKPRNVKDWHRIAKLDKNNCKIKNITCLVTWGHGKKFLQNHRKEKIRQVNSFWWEPGADEWKNSLQLQEALT